MPEPLPRHLRPHAEFGDDASGWCGCAGCDPQETCGCQSCREVHAPASWVLYSEEVTAGELRALRGLAGDLPQGELSELLDYIHDLLDADLDVLIFTDNEGTAQ